MVKKERSQKTDLRSIFLGLQTEMATKLGTARTTVGHPVAKGDVTENSWREMLRKYLPRRYAVEKAFILDSTGATSDQIDLVIFDQHFSPFLFHQESAFYIPAESVYAAFEIKQELTKESLAYAAKKVESVRKLKRTSAHISHIGGKSAPIGPPKEIIGGMLCLASKWKTNLPKRLEVSLSALTPLQKLDLLCILEEGAFDVVPEDGDPIQLVSFPATQALIQFFLSLLHRLQQLGSAPAIDMNAYRRSL